MESLEEPVSQSILKQLELSLKGSGLLQCYGCKKHHQRDALKRCAGCLSVAYCSAECQKAHWKLHKPACRAAAYPLAGLAKELGKRIEASALAAVMLHKKRMV